MQADRLMPPRSFYGSPSNNMIMGLIMPTSAQRRPLAAGESYLGNFILPSFQRPFVWTEAQKVRLIESIYMGMPIGALVWNLTSWGAATDGWLLDGQQRMTTILDYVAGKFAVKGWLYSDLPESETRHFLRMGVAILETNVEDEVTCRDLYDRLAYGGTNHEPLAA